MPRRRALRSGADSAASVAPPRRRNPALLVILVLLILSYAGYRCSPAGGWAEVFAPRVQGDGLKLLRVSDGDSMVLLLPSGKEERVRLVGIDAPELGTPEGFAAAAYAAELLAQASAISYEVEPSSRVDKHGRTLAWVWLDMEGGRRLLLNEEMVRSGHAPLFEFARPRIKHYARLKAAEDHATAQRLSPGSDVQR
jgi:micrococcal nuclease